MKTTEEMIENDEIVMAAKVNAEAATAAYQTAVAAADDAYAVFFAVEANMNEAFKTVSEAHAAYGAAYASAKERVYDGKYDS